MARKTFRSYEDFEREFLPRTHADRKAREEAPEAFGSRLAEELLRILTSKGRPRRGRRQSP